MYKRQVFHLLRRRDQGSVEHRRFGILRADQFIALFKDLGYRLRILPFRIAPQRFENLVEPIDVPFGLLQICLLYTSRCV